MAGNSWLSHLPARAAGQREQKQPEDGYEVMKVIGPQGNKEAGSPAPGGTVNLILSLSSPGDDLVQVLDQPAQAGESVDETAEPVHRVRDLPPPPPPTVVQLHHMTFILCCTRLPVLCPSHPPPLSLSLSTLCLSLLPIKPFGGGARGFWKILWVV